MKTMQDAPRARRTALALAAMSLCPPAALAQAQPRTTDTKALQEVVVTAERRSTHVQKTAISLATVSGDEMREKGQTTLEAALSDTPAVSVMATPQGGQVFVRGVGSQGDSNWVDPAISLNLDGVYSGRAERVFASMYDVARVEVLRGPQGTLYGRNSTGGSVNVLTHNPGPRLGGAVNLQLGNYQLRHADAALNVPLGEQWALRVAALREKREGYFSNGGRASDLSAGRIKLQYRPSNDVTLLATVDSFDSRGAGATTVPRAFAGGPPFFNWQTDHANPWQVDDLHPADVQRTRFTTTTLQADVNLGFGLLSVQPALVKSRRMTQTDLVAGIAAPGSTLPLPETIWEETQKTLELRLAAPARAPWQWVLGAYAFEASNVQTGVPPSFPPPTWESYDTRVPAASRALFGQLTAPLMPGLRGTAGLRHTRDEKTYHYGVHSTAVWTGAAYDSGIQQVSQTYSATTGKLGLEWDLSRQAMAYAQWASGHKAGGFGIAMPPQAYEPEHLDAIELGLKSRFLDNRLQINGELYAYQYKNYQVMYQDAAAPSPVPGDASASFMQYVVNAGAGRIRGFEVESRWRALPDTELRAAFTYNDAHYGHFALAALQGMNGARVVGTPRWSLTLGAEQTWELGDGLGLLRAGWSTRFSDGYTVSLNHSMPGGNLNGQQARFHKTDLRLSYAPMHERWSAGLWLKNLENKAQTTQVLPFGRAQITDPRTVGVNLGWKF
ncbi:TonB-dependent receptor [Aquabacterium sp. OR-4]|uniref:TonB-dependent receptor n=1 Tax=Aquabacterium sp. OR-4 TaxID=2978127 RepID=UPI0028C8B259|nr:TonB-dependent receptor [Aquabacterium sp. OR-4]MDT7836980.1 TonB-dependent receptor [Aquabacterium sp. OR-4]